MKICIDPGHGGSDRGATFQGVDEADIVLIVSYYLERMLKAQGNDAFLTRDQDIRRSLSERVTASNINHADIFVSIHVNADPDDDSPGQPEAKGEEIWYYKAGKDLAECLSQDLDGIFPGHKFRGVKKGGFYVLKHTNAPAILIEMGFLDNTEELRVFTDPGSYKKIAGLIAFGLENYSTTT
jgi:N-acetylmuramoyl-L-alanine amidase